MASTGAVLKKVALPTAVVAVVSTGLAVAVNMATGAEAQWWWWLIVAALTAAGFAGSLWQFLHQSETTTHRTIHASGHRSVAGTGTVSGAITTGNTDAPSAPAPATSPIPASADPAPGSVTASGERSIAFEGNAGSLSTGDTV
ncbi:hypothetical protein [Nocardia sp. NPDC050435]|uniref:hypothetical protein n=1 Tax=Nocardia sp. NPDC050435 TaxID=3155040 RepID=UPI003400F73E